MNRTMAKIVLFIAGISLLFSGTALAENRSTAYTLTPMAGYHMVDGAMDLDDNVAFGLALGYNINRNWGVEADFRYIPTQTVSDLDVNIWTLGLGALYHFQPEQDLNPYLAVGAGGMVFDTDDSSSDDEDVMGYWGGGIKYALNDSAALRVDLRHILDYRADNRGATHDDSTWRHHMQAMFGLTFQYGGVSSVPVKETRVAEPLTESAPLVAKPVDNDADGVLDGVDKCLGTAPGVRVSADGCPSDTDGDGVADFKDACVDTPKGAKVDGRGCPEDADPVAEMALQINFGTNKAAVTPFHQSELAAAVEFINKFPGHKVEVEGHTDSVGDASYNEALSFRRAESVRQALVEKYSVAADRISARGFGENKPLASNDTEEGRMMNRRVEVEILP